MEALLIGVTLYFLFLGMPIILTFINLFALGFTLLNKPLKNIFFGFSEILTFLLGIIYTAILLSFSYGNDYFESKDVSLFGDVWHTPIATSHYLTIVVFFFVGAISYILLRVYRLRLPPLILMILFSFLLIGTADCVIFIIQTLKHGIHFLSLFPFNFIVLSLILMIRLVREYSNNNFRVQHFKNKFLEETSLLLQDSKKWPIYIFLFSMPILITLISILILFGQQPDSFVKAFTDTGDWNLSQKIPTPNISYQGHYLCTVSLRGHPSIVKPLRLGVRHGQKIVVNRQVLVANAFEQLIQERFPRIHRFIRTNYDKYGYPLSRHIQTPRSADIVYILMKPLEWFFTLTLYTFDRDPETRIAKQYLPKER